MLKASKDVATQSHEILQVCVIRFSSLFAARDVSQEVSGRNSILMTQTNVYIINPVVLGFQIQICPILCVFWSILVKCYVHLPTSSSSNASSRKDYIPQILTVLLEILRILLVYI